MKWVKRILAVLVVLVVVAVAAVVFFLGPIVKNAVEKAGPAVVKVPLKLEDARFNLLGGVITLKGFVMGNPEGFKTENLVRVGEVTVEIDLRSLFSDTIVIRRIYVGQPEITYELGLGKSNVGRLLEGLSGGDEPETKPEAEAKPEPQEESGGKKVVIDDLLVENGKIRLSATVAMGAAAPIPLPAVHKTGIGREDGGTGASPVAVVRMVLSEIFGAVTKVVTGSAQLVADGVGKVGDVAVGAVEGAAKGVEKAGGAVIGAGEAVGGAAMDTGKAVGGAVGAAGGKVVEGAGKVLGGVKNVFSGGGAETNQPEEAPAQAE